MLLTAKRRNVIICSEFLAPLELRTVAAAAEVDLPVAATPSKTTSETSYLLHNRVALIWNGAVVPVQTQECTAFANTVALALPMEQGAEVLSASGSTHAPEQTTFLTWAIASCIAGC